MLIRTREEFESARTVLLDADIIVLDTETNWTEHMHNRRMMGFSALAPIKGREPYEMNFYFPFRHKHDRSLFGTNQDNLPLEWLRELRPAIEGRDGLDLVFHNAKFDLAIFEKEGFDFSDAMYWDTMIMAHMADENHFNYELKSLAGIAGFPGAKDNRDFLDKIARDLGGGKKELGWEKIPPEVMAKYAVGDVLETMYLYEWLMPQLVDQELLSLWPKEQAWSNCLKKSQEIGIRIDPVTARTLSAKSQARMQEILTQLGFDPGKPSQLARKLYSKPPLGLGFVPQSLSKRPLKEPIHLSDGRAISFIPIMDEKDELSRYDDPTVSLVLEYRGLQKAVSTWFEGWLEKIDDNDRVHPEFKQHGTVTTRLSCSKPNMQQIPRDIENNPVKTMLRATDGYELWEFDYSQIEYRLAGCYSKEPAIIEAYASGTDMHQITADNLGIPRQALSGKKDGKTINFTLIYGAGPQRLCDELKIPFEEAEEIHRMFWAGYPLMEDTKNEVNKTARIRRWIRYWDGRRRHIRFPKEEAHKAWNSLIQGGAGRILIQSMVNWSEGPKTPYYPVNFVHDSVLWEVPIDGNEEVYRKEIKATMEWASDQFPIPFPVDMKKLA